MCTGSTKQPVGFHATSRCDNNFRQKYLVHTGKNCRCNLSRGHVAVICRLVSTDLNISTHTTLLTVLHFWRRGGNRTDPGEKPSWHERETTHNKQTQFTYHPDRTRDRTRVRAVKGRHSQRSATHAIRIICKIS